MLAELCRRDLVPAIWLPDPRVRAERERARWRLHLVRHRSSLKQRVHAVLLTHGKPCPVSDLFGVRGRQLLARLGLPEPWQGTIEASLRLIDPQPRQPGVVPPEEEREQSSLKPGRARSFEPALGRYRRPTIHLNPRIFWFGTRDVRPSQPPSLDPNQHQRDRDEARERGRRQPERRREHVMPPASLPTAAKHRDHAAFVHSHRFVLRRRTPIPKKRSL